MGRLKKGDKDFPRKLAVWDHLSLRGGVCKDMNNNNHVSIILFIGPCNAITLRFIT